MVGRELGSGRGLWVESRWLMMLRGSRIQTCVNVCEKQDIQLWFSLL